MKSKIEIKDKGYNISDREIESMMEFGAVVERYRTEKIDRKITRKLTTRFSIAIVLLVAIVASFFLLKNIDNDNINSIINSQKLPDVLSNEEAPMINDSVATKHTRTYDSSALQKSITRMGVQEEKRASNYHKSQKEPQDEIRILKGPATTQQEPKKSQPKGEGKEHLYVAAQPLQGTDHLYTYFEENLAYPEIALNDSIEGVLEVQFTVLADSSITDITVIKSLGAPFDKEAIRVIQAMPRWIPATANGEPVSSRLSIPLTFNIEK